MKTLERIASPSVRLLLALLVFVQTHAWAQSSSPGPIEGFADINGVRLQYLDWGGSGPPLILIHGLADNPYVFNDLAPAFTDQHHVIAYARRGSGSSDVRGPYDIVTLTEDLRSLMDALGIRRADLVGYSAGGDETTNFAAEYPDRVGRIVYLDAAYDFTEPDFRTVVSALPVGFFKPPVTAMSSLDAYRAYQRRTYYPELSDTEMGRIDANLRAKVVVQPDGTLRERTPGNVVEALYQALWTDKRRQYARVRCPALAIYSDTLYDQHIADPKRRNDVAVFEQTYWKPFQEKSIDRVRRELAHVEVTHITGAHGNFTLTNREWVTDTMRRFLEGSSQATAQVAH